MKLDNKTHVVVYDLMECYKAVTAERVRNSLLVAINRMLAAALDPQVRYQITGFRVYESDLKMYMYPDGANEDVPADLIHTIDVQTGVYTTTRRP